MRIGTVVVVLAALLLIGARLLLAPVTGDLLVLASARQLDRVGASTIELRDAAGWHDLGSTHAHLVPKVPETATLLQAAVPIGSYDAIRLAGKVVSGRIEVQRDVLTPVLVVVASGRPRGAVYAGDQDVGLGLNELAGHFRTMPSFGLLDQFSRPFTNATIAGHDVVLAAFHTSCHETCPLYTGLFLQLRRRLPPPVLLVEATTDPQEDTPGVLRAYAGRVGASWTFVTGSPDAMAAFWKPFDVELSSGDVHRSELAIIDSHGYIRTYYLGTPDLGRTLPSSLRSQLDQDGQRLLGSHGDGWGTSQVVDALQTIGGLAAPSTGGEGAAPSFSLRTLTGRSVQLAEYRGRPLLINFWASWCVPCREEMPLIQRTASQHPGLVVLLVNERDDPGAARRFVQEVSIRSTVLLDQDGGVGDRYRISGLPTTVFVRPDGSIEGRYIGQTNESVLSSHIAAIGA
jgi:cytochrome oxidase Cu insertion factor (SCO1/SenC/PrrC family)